MSVVEKRVLGEVANGLENIRNSFAAVNQQAYPWLAPFNDPSVSNFLWTANTFNGHLSMHIPNQNYVNVSPFTVNWSGLPAAGAPITFGTPPSAACLSDANCLDIIVGAVRNVVTALTPVSCIWQNRFSFNCTGTDNVTNPFLFRTYIINYVDNGTGNLTFNAPTATLPRTRNLTVNGALTGNLTITITDTGANVGSTSFTFPAGTPLTSLITNGIDYHIDANGVDLTLDGDVNDAGEQGDLPDWFRVNNWHHQVMVAYPTNLVEPLPGVSPAAAIPTICVPPNCLTLTSNGINGINNIRALAVIAGQALPGKLIPGPDTRPPFAVALTDYLDGINLVPLTNTYDQQIFNTVFNDQVRIIRTTTTLPP